MTGEKKMFTSYVKNKDSLGTMIFVDGNQGKVKGIDKIAIMKRPDPLGLKCDTITSPRRLVTTFLQIVHSLNKCYYNTRVQARERARNTKCSRR
jgi:hypothetical protein